MIVISNAGPLIALAKLGQARLLVQLYGNILIAPEIYQEVVVRGLEHGEPDAVVIELLVSYGHIIPTEVHQTPYAPSICQLPIDLGEIQTIYLAL